MERSCPAPQRRILFVGNSYTACNDLANTVAQLLKTAEGTEPYLQAFTNGGASFATHAQLMKEPGTPQYQHLGAGTEKWDTVIFQDQSQTPGFYPYGAHDSPFARSLAGLKELVAKAEQQGARQLIMFATWGRRERDEHNPCLFSSFDKMNTLITQGYDMYKQAVAAQSSARVDVAPVGTAFALIHKRPDAPVKHADLYGGDGSHPATPATLLAALLLTSVITNKPIMGPAFNHVHFPMPPEQRDFLQQIAQEVLQGCTFS